MKGTLVELTAILILLSGFSTLQTNTFVSSEDEAQCFPEVEKRREVIRPVWEAQREEILIWSQSEREAIRESVLPSRARRSSRSFVIDHITHLLLLNIVDLDLSRGLQRRRTNEERGRRSAGRNDLYLVSSRRGKEERTRTSPAASKSPSGLKFNA